MRRNIVIAAMLLIPLLIGCKSRDEEGKNGGEPLRAETKKSVELLHDERFAIYLLSDSSIDAGEALRQDINSLPLDNTPLITASEIDAYYWDEHVIRLAPGLGYLVPTVGKVGVSGLPFVVTARGKRIYLGAFWTCISSISFSGPVIYADIPEFQNDSSRVLAIKLAYPSDDFSSGPDPRGDPLIRAALEDAGKINLEGLDSSTREELEEKERFYLGE